MRERLSADQAAQAAPRAAAAPVRAVAQPDPTFAELYRDAHADMVRLAYLLTGSVEVARDVVQDAFVSVYNAWTRVREPRAYLRRSVVNGCTSHHRRVFRDRHKHREPAPAVEFYADELFDVLATLPPRQRAAVVLRFWHDLDERAIADALGCRVGTVGSLLHRAMGRLREVIDHE